MKQRYRDILEDGTPLYRQRGGVEYDSKVNPLIARYQELFAKIQAGARETENGWERTEAISEADKEEMKRIKKMLQDEQLEGGRGKNVLGFSSWKDEKLDSGKDNTVFTFDDGKSRLDGYVYKEAIPPKVEGKNGKEYGVMDGSNLKYLQRKYHILKTFLGTTIPQSAFVLGEASRKRGLASGLPNTDEVRQTIITIQRRVKGKNLKDMTLAEKQDPSFLSALQKAHRQYILLKIFMQTIAEEQGFPPNTLDVKMDLGRLSDMETLDINNPTTIREALLSPNIMYDGKKIYFIDLDQGAWNETKESLYQYLLSPDIQQRWKDMKKSMGII